MGVEDGTITGYLDTLQIPHTAPSTLICSLSQNKYLTKRLLQPITNVIDDYYLTKEEFRINRTYHLNNIEKLLPVIIKPNRLGSSIGISVVHDKKQLETSLIKALQYGDILIEKVLQNYDEYSCAILSTPKENIISSIYQANFDNEFYSFEDKYKTTCIKQATLSESLENEISETTLYISKMLSLIGLIRIDYLYDKDTSTLYLLEINAIPGTLSLSMFEDKEIYSYQILDKLIEAGLNRFYLKKPNTYKTDILNSKIYNK